MYIPAHIGNIPVEEWLPFLVPVLAVYLYGRRELRRRREAVALLPDVGEGLDDATVSRVLARWSATDHKEVSSEYLPLLYPPGPDGMTAADLAARIHSNAPAVARQLENLADLGYVELEGREGPDESRALLTAEGYDLLIITEEVLLSSLPGHSLEAEDSDRG
jgi:hypothetical protein